jgi:uncharacterized protein HemX
MGYLSLLKIFLNWRVLLALTLAGAAAFILFKFHSIQDDLKKAQDQVVIEQANNQILRTNVDTLSQVNAENGRIIAQQQKDTATIAQTLDHLSRDLAKSSGAFAEIGKKIDLINVPPTKLTPYFKEAINGIQEQRDLLAAPPGAAPEKDPSK